MMLLHCCSSRDVLVVIAAIVWQWPCGPGNILVSANNSNDAVAAHHHSNASTSRTKICPLNACEVLVYISQNFQQLKQPTQSQPTQRQRPGFGHATVGDEQQQPQGGNGHGKMLDVLAMQRDVESRVKAVERRLRSVEQPVWRLSEGSATEWNRCTEGHCRCLVVTKSLSCWNSGLRSVPQLQTVPMDTLTIDMSANLLTTLNKETFRGLTHLHVLDLSHNELDYLPKDLLGDLDGLVKLRLQKNNLEDLHAEAFLKLRNLRILDLSHNRLLRLSEDIFHDVRHLVVVNLAHNRLTALPVQLLHELVELEEFDITNNQLQAVRGHTFHSLRSLKSLDMSDNRIETIADSAFVRLDRLELLNLRENRLSEISLLLFRNISSLMHLDLSLNRIRRIHLHAFELSVNMVDLLLGQNALSHIPGRLFGRLGPLRKLMLFSNNLTALHNDTFLGLQNLTTLLLNNNILKDLNADAFKPMRNLVKLRLDSNKLQFLPPGCLDGRHLRAVKLDKNPWHCDCRAIYLARWLRSSQHKLWDGEPQCRGPGDLGGNPVGDLRFSDMCDGQWAAMVSLAARLPVRPVNLADGHSPYGHLREGFTNLTMNAERRREEAAARAASMREAEKAVNASRPIFSPF